MISKVCVEAPEKTLSSPNPKSHRDRASTIEHWTRQCLNLRNFTEE